MSTTTRRIQQIITDDFSALNPGQIGYSTSADDVMGKRAFGGKNDEGIVSTFLEKDQNIRVKTVDTVGVSTPTTEVSPLIIKSYGNEPNYLFPVYETVVLSASHVLSTNGVDYVAPNTRYEAKEFTIKFKRAGNNPNGMVELKLTNESESIYGDSRTASIAMTNNSVIMNAYDVSMDVDGTAVGTNVVSTFACLTLVYDSRNTTYGYDAVTPKTYWWNVGTASNSDFLIQPQSMYGETGVVRVTSGGNFSVNDTFKVYGNSATYAAEAVFSVPVIATSSTNSSRLDKLSCSMYVTTSNPSVLYIRVKGDDGNLRIGSIPLSM